MSPQLLRESAAESPQLTSSDSVAGIRITHADRVLFPEIGIRKIELARYYEAVADWILPHLIGRPLTLKQCAPDSEHCRYLRHSGERAPAEVRIVRIQEQTKIGDYMVVDNLEALIALVQRNIVEFHTWSATMADLEHPDRLVFDLDPGPDVSWGELVTAARLTRETLREIGLESWVKTTGGKGLHVVAPIVRGAAWPEHLAYARSVAEAFTKRDPKRYTTRFAKRERPGRILIDYLRNNRTTTSVAAYSVRAHPRATVSTPLSWDELTSKLRPERWTIRTIPRRLETLRDPWADYFKTRQRIRK